jgi:serine/threonine protein kinase
MESLDTKLSKLNTINDRIVYLRKIINREIQLKPGQMEWLSNPCEMRNNIRSSGGKYFEIGGGAYGKVFKVCIDEICNYEFALKEIQYSDDKSYLGNGNPYRSENVEVRIFKLLNELVVNGLTPHIPLYMGDFNCTIKNVEYKYVMVEKADGNLLQSNLMNNDEILRNILFQILYTLKIIHKHYPAFIHNDLKPSNVLIFNPPKSLNGYYKYILDDKVYYLPNSYRAAIWDFGISSIICEKCDNALVEDLIAGQSIGVQTEQNQYKDIFKLFYELSEKYLGIESKKFVEKFIYRASQMDSFGNLLPNIEPFSIDQMLNDSFFDPFRIPVTEDQIIETYQNKPVIKKVITVITSEPPFECSSYEDNQIAYFEYRNSQHNDLDRTSCYKTSDDDILDVNHPDLMTIISKSYDFDNIMDFGIKRIKDFDKISDDDRKRIVDLYYDLMVRFIKNTYVPYVNEILSDVLKLVILNKAVFLITKIHHPITLKHTFKYIDYTIQFNQFLCYGY